jgi:putative copper export protein
MKSRLRRSSFAPWAGLFLGALAWFGHNQVSNAVYWDCRLGGALLTAGTAIGFGALAIVGGLISWAGRAAPPSSTDRPESRAFGSVVGVMAAAIFLFTILLQALAGFIVPGCAP